MGTLKSLPPCYSQSPLLMDFTHPPPPPSKSGLKLRLNPKKTWCMGPMPELTITSPYIDSRVDYNTFTMGNPIPESTLTLCQSRLYPPSQGLRIWHLVCNVNIVYGNLTSENFQDFFRKPQRNCTFVNSASA
jgi:hypothetical protein